MQLGLQDPDAYLGLWARSAAQERPGRAAEVADAIVGELEARFPEFISHAFRRP